MGNRESLLAGAKRCLLSQGFSHVTARDVAAESGVSLAAIGYHYGTTQALLTAALMSAIQDLDVEFRRAALTEEEAKLSPMARFEATWSRLIESLSQHRQLWAANIEIFAQVERVPALRALIDDGLLQRTRVGLVSLFQGVSDESVDSHSAQTLGAFYHALLIGILMQWAIDPKNAPSGHDLGNALRMIAGESNVNRAGSRRID